MSRNYQLPLFTSSRVYKLLFLIALIFGAYLMIKTKPNHLRPRLLQQSEVHKILRQSKAHTHTETETKTKTVLLWNIQLNDEYWKLSKATLLPMDLKNTFECPVFDCILTENRSFLLNDVMYNAILFQLETLNNTFNIPSFRHENQNYIFAAKKSAAKKAKFEDLGFNRTMTYRLDSDIVWTNYKIEDIKTGTNIAPALNPHWRKVSKTINNDLWNLWKKKNQTAVYFINDCFDKAERFLLANNILEYIPIVAYGTCKKVYDLRNCSKNFEECDGILKGNFKFFLALEHGLCEDYLMDEIFMALNQSIVPVIHGGAKYTRFLPPNSYVQANDFKTTKDFGEFLQNLSNNAFDYLQYFWWQDHYRVVKSLSPICELCEKLHSFPNNERTQWYRDIKNWWYQDQCRNKTHLKSLQILNNH